MLRLIYTKKGVLMSEHKIMINVAFILLIGISGIVIFLTNETNLGMFYVNNPYNNLGQCFCLGHPSVQETAKRPILLNSPDEIFVGQTTEEYCKYACIQYRVYDNRTYYVFRNFKYT